ncbi:MAG: PadR family transcriptional regulator [Gammaproteobacteria bacterium]|jgi:DNA-binding PadR family transcriptional regulator|nr:PadR family transcriptional regulator [Gammaproteobacteria bacterium]MDH3848696.1 PadR family transcriptional regulator [Gammaproteobacteria bacterium]MDH3862632.1 PadR family transcriptional regulator [Gammaproteobacteria bacterium]MDH3906586.1 PadR family transcriptional regulator [Gammaproteobacteria bacterium]MDH3909517.1 PadR family transcriptional regulator [Gammaproteobacteria bacterium]
MDVKTVCLGMLTDGEASGYDLKKEFESSFSHFFAAGYGSIYPALNALARDGMVECRHVPQEGKPDRKVYTITAAGRDHLLAALENPCPSHKVRSEFLATMCFAHLMSREQIETVLDNRVKEMTDYLQLFREFETTSMDDWPPGARFVLGFGQTMMKTMREYVEENRDKLFDKTGTGNKTAIG